MSKKTRCQDILSEDNECIIEFKPCEMIKSVNINVDVEPESDECCCNLSHGLDNMFVMQLVCSILSELNSKCTENRHRHKHKNKHKHKDSNKHNHC
ncbi:hypothetical protein HBE96_15435 [Clostridium sp. P21]|uniref:Uncharacterized protein n=1 Tax=Clostridium muellerianum TaxID=2716538 RepID=A0A7Y0EID7_9CLOT|nr:hypothetical protein [Clostridium muellerianum]NMM64039.1 hypothetical protein [Clostridium muellerianum]